MITNTDRVMETLRRSPGLDDNELARQAGVELEAQRRGNPERVCARTFEIASPSARNDRGAE